MLEKIFHLKENHTDVKTELMAGVTTFMTMAYILAVNPSILSASGMDANAVLIATSLASFVGTALMALLANYPFALAPGMGLNAYFSYTVVLTMGYSWQLALMAVFVEGIIFIVLSLTNVREAIFNAIPMTLKSAVSVGIGLFVAFVGLQNAKLIVNSDSTLVTYQHFKGETFHSIGVGAILALVGVLITAILLVKKVKGGILYGILITWVLGILCELTGIYIPNPDAGMYSVIPTSFISFDFSALGKTFGQVFKTDFSGVGILNFFAVMFSFLFVDLFDTLGTLIGVASKADMLDEEGKLPNIKGALMADSIATCAGAVLGTSTTTTFVEKRFHVLRRFARQKSFVKHLFHFRFLLLRFHHNSTYTPVVFIFHLFFPPSTNALKSSLFGFSNAADALPLSSALPSCKNSISSATLRANSISCVTTIIVRPSAFNSPMSAEISPVRCGSSSEVGSSKHRIFGCNASARAIATRCCCPPESSHGYAPSFSASPTFSRSNRAFSAFFALICFFFALFSLRGNFSPFKAPSSQRSAARDTFRSAVYCGNN